MPTTKPPYFPTKVQILGRTFTVTEQPEENTTDDGNMYLADQEITIRKQPSLEYNQDTMLHEIIHAIDEVLILGITEEQVHKLTVGLLSVLKQNKSLVKWLTKDV